jgi:DNA-binding response OmpR family regulator
MNTVLLLEDDLALSHGVAVALESDELHIRKYHTLVQAMEEWNKDIFQLVILDINLPDGSGLEFLRKIRTESDVPVILLTANDLETDVVSGLEKGADDYITKPFSLAILRARVDTQLRRTSVLSAAVQIDSFCFDFDHMEYTRGGQKIELSKTEQKLLRLLVENRGRTLTRELLLDRIWTDGADYVDENALSVTVKRLRDKLEAPAYIKTVYGIGYSWVTGHD